MKNKIIVIGAGAAGLMAAAAAADTGAAVTVLEKNEKAGKKIYITGKGRCNLTNACQTQDFFDHVVRNPKFLYSAVYGYDQFQVMQFMRDNGCPVKTERGNRVFPVSDHASDVTKALLRHLQRRNVSIQYHCEADTILTDENVLRSPDSGDNNKHRKTETAYHVTGVRLRSGEILPADSVILCTGGLSYPSTGSDGDGLRMARELGLIVKPAFPSLVPLVTEEDWCRQLQGLSLKNVQLTLLPAREAAPLQEEDPSRREAEDFSAVMGKEQFQNRGEKKGKKSTGKKGRKRCGRPIYTGFGEMLFTHFGVSGPLILTASCYTDFESEPQGYLLKLDLKPALTQEQLEARLQRELEAAPGRHLANVLRSLFPARLAEIVASISGLGTDTVASSVHEREVGLLAALVKSVPIHITGSRGFSEAIITRGGLDVRQFDPSTMECREISGLYAAGEVLDVDAHTGGFNLQIAWSTGHLAGESAAQKA